MDTTYKQALEILKSKKTYLLTAKKMLKAPPCAEGLKGLLLPEINKIIVSYTAIFPYEWQQNDTFEESAQDYYEVKGWGHTPYRKRTELARDKVFKETSRTSLYYLSYLLIASFMELFFYFSLSNPTALALR